MLPISISLLWRRWRRRQGPGGKEKENKVQNLWRTGGWRMGLKNVKAMLMINSCLSPKRHETQWYAALSPHNLPRWICCFSLLSFLLLFFLLSMQIRLNWLGVKTQHKCQRWPGGLVCFASFVVQLSLWGPPTYSHPPKHVWLSDLALPYLNFQLEPHLQLHFLTF